MSRPQRRSAALRQVQLQICVKHVVARFGALCTDTFQAAARPCFWAGPSVRVVGLVRLTAGDRMRSLPLSIVACSRCRPVGLGLNPDSASLQGLMTSRYRGGGAVPRHHGGRESHPTSVNTLSRSDLPAGPSDLPTIGRSGPNEVALSLRPVKRGVLRRNVPSHEALDFDTEREMYQNGTPALELAAF